MNSLIRIFTKFSETGNIEGQNEFFKVSLEQLKAVIGQLQSGIGKSGIEVNSSRTDNFKLRREQREAISLTKNAYNNGHNKFLWNAKMRFGKTFTSYKLIEEMGFDEILMITYKPSVINSWIDDLSSHVDFDGWGYSALVGGNELHKNAREGKPTIIFKSFQDVKQRDKNGEIKDKNKELYSNIYDLIIFDEYHFGSWNENSKNEFTKEYKVLDNYQDWLNDKTNNLIKGKYKLFLSGTPFRVLSIGEFDDDEVFTWSYKDEQIEKNREVNKENVQYASLPKMILMGYKLPDEFSDYYMSEETNEFSLNAFFKSTDRKFANEDDVIKFLRWISGYGSKVDLGFKPFSDKDISHYVDHTYWMLPSVSACYAMMELLNSGIIPLFDDYEVILAADSKGNTTGQKAYRESKR